MNDQGTGKKIKTIADLYTNTEKSPKRKKLVVAAAQDEHVLDAVTKARERGIVEPILVGIRKKILEIAHTHGYDLDRIRIIDEEDNVRAAEISVQLVRDGEADILMKGLLDTATYLRPVLDKANGLRRGEALSSIGLFELTNYHKLFVLTDGGLNIAPDLKMKVAIIKNAVFFMRRLGVEIPKVAVLGAFELININMIATVDAALLSMMSQRGQIRNCIIDGPLSFDNAISKKSAEFKGIHNDVAGDADILLAPNIESGNAMYKSFVYFAGASPASMLLGASAPIVLTSRADSEAIKLNSIALAASIDLSDKPQ
ncbi:MAG: bifunctional enoyl-CoA hydratase/phosphate acetyltransferase [Spirochaetota bacterium]